MPIFNDFSQNGQLLSVRDEPLNAQNFSRYIAEHGIEQAKGYQDASADLLKQIHQILYHLRADGGFGPNTPATIRRSLLDFYQDRQELINTSEKLIPKAESVTLSKDSDTKLTP